MPVGNAWHLPTQSEPRGRSAMRDPVGPVPAGSRCTVISGNQYAGDGGDPGNQLQDGSAVLVRRTVDPDWTEVPLVFQVAEGTNKFFGGQLPAFAAGDQVRYYLRIAYDDHDLTFVHALGDGSGTTVDEAVAQTQAFAFTVADPATTGRWGPIIALPNVGIHASLLPSGDVLMWGRRMPGNPDLDVLASAPFLWNPRNGQITDTPPPKDLNQEPVNLFCAGHTFLADGRLLVLGGHETDGGGIDQACLYDHVSNTWTPTARMNNGRWYPTATILPDGRVLVLSGSFKPPGQGAENNREPQIWSDGAWTPFPPLPQTAPFELYPRMHVVSGARLVMSGPLKQTWAVGVAGGPWTGIAAREMNQRDYCPALTYAPGRILYIGGGNNGNDSQPTAAVEKLDLNQPAPAWSFAPPMAMARQQHNATFLADGTILVTGGTSGPGFNNLGAGQPVHVAEIFDPEADNGAGTWTTVAAEEMDRCYHSTAVLLPDGTVLSAGGGEYKPGPGVEPNAPQDSHADAQVFSPPYLFRGGQPVITEAPPSVSLGETFEIGTDQPNQITKVTWIRLSSVTHSLNASQHLEVLVPQVVAGRLRLTAPDPVGGCPPGHYLMFAVNAAGVPSEARVLQVLVGEQVVDNAPPAQPAQPVMMAQLVPTRPTGTEVVVHLSGLCPYGIGACWGGAYEALQTLERVAWVDPVPDAERSTATVILADTGIPPIERWHEEFARVVNGRYTLHGFDLRQPPTS